MNRRGEKNMEQNPTFFFFITVDVQTWKFDLKKAQVETSVFQA